MNLKSTPSKTSLLEKEQIIEKINSNDEEKKRHSKMILGMKNYLGGQNESKIQLEEAKKNISKQSSFTSNENKDSQEENLDSSTDKVKDLEVKMEKKPEKVYSVVERRLRSAKSNQIFEIEALKSAIEANEEKLMKHQDEKEEDCNIDRLDEIKELRWFRGFGDYWFIQTFDYIVQTFKSQTLSLLAQTEKKLRTLKDLLDQEQRDFETTNEELKKLQGEDYDEDEELPAPRKKPKFYMQFQREAYLKKTKAENDEIAKLDKRPPQPEYTIVTNKEDNKNGILKRKPSPSRSIGDRSYQSSESEDELPGAGMVSDGIQPAKKMPDSLIQSHERRRRDKEREREAYWFGFERFSGGIWL